MRVTLFNLELVETEDDKYYAITGLNKDYSKGENKDGNLVIPEAIDDIPVKKLVSKEKSFSDYRDITKIVISKNIIYIGTSTTDESLGNKIFKEAYNLKFIEVSEENPVYKSLNGILFNKDASILLKMPNRFGLDVFGANIYRDRIEPFGSGLSYEENQINCRRLETGVTCSKFYLMGGQFFK